MGDVGYAVQAKDYKFIIRLISASETRSYTTYACFAILATKEHMSFIRHINKIGVVVFGAQLRDTERLSIKAGRRIKTIETGERINTKHRRGGGGEDLCKA